MRRALARRLLIAGGGLVLAACVRMQGSLPASDVAERRQDITMMLENAARNWNRGDLDAFVSDYLPGTETTFIGSRGVLRGTDAIRAAYAPRFAPGGIRDSLSFELLDVDALSSDLTHVIARYTLARHVGARDSVTSRGPTSLMMRRVNGRWRIVHDHSS